MPFIDDPVRDEWARSRGFSRQGGIRTVIAGDSRTYLSSAVDKTGGVTTKYEPDTLGKYYIPGAGAFASTADYGYFTWADALMGAQHFLLNNAGIGGDTTDGLLLRYQADVIDLKPELIYLWIGYNDFNNGRSFEYVRDNVLKLLAMGNSILAFTCFIDVPITAVLAGNAGRAAEAVKFNAWLRDLVRDRRDMVLVSASAAMADPDYTVVGVRPSLVLTDTTHNNNLGAMRVGEAVQRAMQSVTRGWLNYPVSPLEGWDSSPGNALKQIRSSNPLMAGTTGVLGTGVTGSVATGYGVQRAAGSPTIAASKVAERHNIGDAQRLAMTFAAANDGVTLGVMQASDPLAGNASGRYLPNYMLEGQCDVLFSDNSAALINRMELYVAGTFNGVAFNTTAMRRVISSLDQGVADNIQPLPLAGKFLRLRTPRVYVSGTCTLLQYCVRFFGSGAGTVTADVSRFAIRQRLLGTA